MSLFEFMREPVTWFGLIGWWIGLVITKALLDLWHEHREEKRRAQRIPDRSGPDNR